MKNSKNLIIYCLCILGLVGCISFALYLLSLQNQNENQISTETLLSTTAISIIDGDTFETASGETIRLLCVDTPEKTQAGYEEASAFLSSLILGKDVKVEREHGKDKYNRTLAWVSVDNKAGGDFILVNKMIVDEGFGSVFEYNNTDCGRMKS